MHHLVAFNILFVNTAFYMIEGTRKLCQDLCLILLIFFRNDTLSRTLCLELLFLNRYEAHKLVFSRNSLSQKERTTKLFVVQYDQTVNSNLKEVPLQYLINRFAFSTV
jgi:hypothetical protein